VSGPPAILAIEWGRVEVEGLGVFKDVKLWPGGGRSWDWNETGTRHRPGVQLADCVELVEHGANTIILGTGMNDALGVSPGTVAELEERGVAVEAAPTLAAVARYRELAAGSDAVGALIHSTC
jgi:hypothetical protein